MKESTTITVTALYTLEGTNEAISLIRVSAYMTFLRAVGMVESVSLRLAEEKERASLSMEIRMALKRRRAN